MITEAKLPMRCTCGYSFSAPENRDEGAHEGYLVVHDKDYRKFLRSEIRAVERSKAKDKEGAMRALGKSATFAGSMKKCPVCGNYSWNSADLGEVVHLKPVKKRVRR